MRLDLKAASELVGNNRRLLIAGITLCCLGLAAMLGRRASISTAAVIAAAALLLALVQRPESGLVAIAALSFTVPISLGTGTDVALTPPVFLIGATAIAWLLAGLLGHSLRLPSSTTFLPLFLFVAAGLVSLLAGRAYWDPLVPQPTNLTMVQLGQWAIVGLSAACFVLASALGRSTRALETATWVFLIMSSFVVLEFLLPPSWRILGWSSGNMANRSLLWVWLGSMATGQLLYNQRLSRMARVWLALMLASAAYVLWFKQNVWTSGWGPFTISVSVVVWLWVWRRNRTAGLLVAIALLVLAVALSPAVFEHTGGETELDLSWGGRLKLYRTTIDLVAEHPLLGLGPAAYRQYGFAKWLSLGAGRALYIRPNISSHNNFIDIYAQQGLAGLALFLWFLLEEGRSIARSLNSFAGDFREGYVQGALGGFIGTVVAMLLADWFLPFVYNIGFPGFRTSALAWLFLGGLIAVKASADDVNPSESP